jgi:hypothetical protein
MRAWTQRQVATSVGINPFVLCCGCTPPSINSLSYYSSSNKLEGTMLKFLTAALFAAAITTPAFAEDVAATVIAMERAALDRSDKGDVKGFLEISAVDVVYQDPFLTQPLKGLEALTAYYKGFPAEEPSHGVMKDATVQQYGEFAVLSFHYTSGADTKHPVEWNTTEVYCKTTDGWRIVNTHWSLTKTQP